MERIRNIYRRFHGNPQVGTTISGGADMGSPSPNHPQFITNLEHPVVPSPKPGAFLDERKLAEEYRTLFQNLKITGDAAHAPIVISSVQDQRRWATLDRTFVDDIRTIQMLQHERLGEIDKSGATSLIEVAAVHIISVGSEIVARRNLQQQLGLARKYGVEDKKGPYFQLLAFFHGLATSIRIGEITLQDFITPKGKSPVGHYRFLAQACLVVDRSLYDEILSDNLEPPKNAYPNTIKRVIWSLPNTMMSLLIVNPDFTEQVYRNSKYPLNEMGLAAAQLIRGIKEARERTFRLILNPRSEHFQELKQVLQVYLSSGDKQSVIVALNVLGLNNAPNISELYRQSRKYAREGTEQEFFARLGNLVYGYARDVVGMVSLLTIDDVATILDTDVVHSTQLQVPSFEQLGRSVSETFNLSSRRTYDIDPNVVAWGNLGNPEAVSIEFDTNRPRRFTVKLEYNAEQGEPDINFTLDTSKNIMDWHLVEDPMFPENGEVDYLRKNLVTAAAAILSEVARQAREEYTSRHQPKTAQIAQDRVKKERFDDPAYRLRKEVKAEAKEKKKAAETVEDQVSIGELIQSLGIKKQIELLEGEAIGKKFIGISSTDQEIIEKAIAEFNERGVGDFRRKSTRPGSEPRYDLRVNCSVPKGARVLMRESNSGNGVRRFEIINITYRGKSWRINKLWQR